MSFKFVCLSWATCRGPPLQLQPFGLACSCLESLTWSILTELHATFLWQVLTWEICWFWRYRVKKLPYAWEDACYLTQTSLKIPASTWKNIGNLQFHQTNVGFGCGLGYGGKRCTRGNILDIGGWNSPWPRIVYANGTTRERYAKIMMLNLYRWLA